MAVDVNVRKGGTRSPVTQVPVAEAWVEDAVRQLRKDIGELKRHAAGGGPLDKRLAVCYARKCTTRSLPEIAKFFNMSLGAVLLAIKEAQSL